MVRVCSRCGGEITDLSLHPLAKLCSVCRAAGKSYGFIPAVRDYLDRHDWPSYVSARTITEMEPGILVGHESRTMRQNRTAITRCLKQLGYVAYTTKEPTLKLKEILK